ncbi:MAG TPA: response regulator [Steroidobacteraceae bacterium]|nr:response regulator [Steroidobacteraceae bacterium]
MRILVIDDEAFVREALERVLKSPATTVVGAPDAAAGLALMRQSPVDLVIVDVVLPGMDGAAVVKEIRRDYPRVRIIAISGGGNIGLSAYRPEAISTNAYLAACSKAGADRVLPKPFETAELRAMIEEVFSAEGA